MYPAGNYNSGYIVQQLTQPLGLRSLQLPDSVRRRFFLPISRYNLVKIPTNELRAGGTGVRFSINPVDSMVET